jgi:hypothetical protein
MKRLPQEGANMGNMIDVINAIERRLAEGAPFGAFGGNRGKGNAIAKRDAEMAAKRKLKMLWKAEHNEQYERYHLFYDGTIEYGRI